MDRRSAAQKAVARRATIRTLKQNLAQTTLTHSRAYMERKIAELEAARREGGSPNGEH